MIKKSFLLLMASISVYAMTYEEVKSIEKKDGVIKTLALYKDLVKKNDPNAMLRLAQIYINGNEIQKSFSKAHDLLKKASSLNHNKSTFYLGKFYLSKKTSYYDLTKAYNAFIRSANNGYAPSQNMIGQFLLNGIVINKDYKMAVKYFERASKQQYIDAQCNLAFMYASGKGVFPNFGRAHAFAKEGKRLKNKKCMKVWEDYKLGKYPEDKAWKFKFYTKP